MNNSVRIISWVQIITFLSKYSILGLYNNNANMRVFSESQILRKWTIHIKDNQISLNIISKCEHITLLRQHINNPDSTHE